MNVNTTAKRPIDSMHAIVAYWCSNNAKMAVIEKGIMPVMVKTNNMAPMRARTCEAIVDTKRMPTIILTEIVRMPSGDTIEIHTDLIYLMLSTTYTSARAMDKMECKYSHFNYLGK